MAVPQYIPTVINDIVTDNVSYGSAWATSRWKTFIAETFDGGEFRNIDWVYAKGRGTITLSQRQQASDMQPVIDLHTNTQGRAIPFGFRDPLDSQAVNEVIATADGALVAFQIVKVYSVPNGNPYVRKLTKPTQGTVVVRVNAVAQVEGTDYSVDYLTGIITFATPPANLALIAADFDYVIPVRFSSDELPITFDGFDQYSLNIGIEEVL